MAIRSVNPATGEILREFPASAWPTVDGQLANAAGSFTAWSSTPVAERAEVLRRAAVFFEEERDALGSLATREMGKPITGAREEAAKCATACRYYADHAARFLDVEAVDGPDQGVRYQPLGVVLAIMPWNFPFWQAVRFAAPALAAGNVGILKHASNVPQCALALEDVFRRAGAPAGVFQTLLIGSDTVDRVIADPRVAAVTLTGSETAGRAVATTAGHHLKKCVLELGGSDPFVVLADADVEAAAVTAVKARLVNSGQSCIAAKRFIVEAPVYERFVATFVARLGGCRVGDPMDETTEIGPLATGAIRDALAHQVRTSVAGGARVLLGGEAAFSSVPGRGSYYPPTVLADIPRDAPVLREEVFGPVAAVVRVGSADEALAIANDTPYGLGASVWTRNRALAERFATGLQVGSVFVNGMVASDARFPFGGVKASGYGRELGAFGLREFVNVKTVRMTL